jgi:hypothetical protein
MDLDDMWRGSEKVQGRVRLTPCLSQLANKFNADKQIWYVYPSSLRTRALLTFAALAASATPVSHHVLATAESANADTATSCARRRSTRLYPQVTLTDWRLTDLSRIK